MAHTSSCIQISQKIDIAPIVSSCPVTCGNGDMPNTAPSVVRPAYSTPVTMVAYSATCERFGSAAMPVSSSVERCWAIGLVFMGFSGDGCWEREAPQRCVLPRFLSFASHQDLKKTLACMYGNAPSAFDAGRRRGVV